MCWGRWEMDVVDGLKTERDRVQVDVSDALHCGWDILVKLRPGRKDVTVSMSAVAAGVAVVAAVVAVGSVGWAEVWAH